MSAESAPPAALSLIELRQVRSVATIAPAYLTAADYPWLRAVLEERARFVGQRRRAWRERIAQPWGHDVPRRRLKLAAGVLDHMAKDRALGSTKAREVRAVVFREAAREPDRVRALARAAQKLGSRPDALLESLFADLPDERALSALPEPLSPEKLALLCNASLIAGLLHKALRVRIAARGNVRAVVRQAKLTGLLCEALPSEAKDGVLLEVSGPYALFRHARVYGRALASLVPRLAWCTSYRLEADCVLDNDQRLGRLVLASGDPIAAARELAPFDSKLEERFARSFAKLAPDWDVLREPLAITAGEALIFPDFELRHRGTGERWLLEIAGYWTPEYVERKLSLLARAEIERLILCIDDDRCCAAAVLEDLARVVRYRRRLDARAVLAIVDPGAARAFF